MNLKTVLVECFNWRRFWTCIYRLISIRQHPQLIIIARWLCFKLSIPVPHNKINLKRGRWQNIGFSFATPISTGFFVNHRISVVFFFIRHHKKKNLQASYFAEMSHFTSRLSKHVIMNFIQNKIKSNCLFLQWQTDLSEWLSWITWWLSCQNLLLLIDKLNLLEPVNVDVYKVNRDLSFYLRCFTGFTAVFLLIFCY